MSNREDRIIQTADVAKEFGLQEPLAREIIMEKTRQALIRSKLAWAILLAGFAIAGWMHFGADRGSSSGLWIGIFTLCAWMATGRYIAGEAIRHAAREKAQRIHGING